MVKLTIRSGKTEIVAANFGHRLNEHTAPYQLAARLLSAGLPDGRWRADLGYDRVSGQSFYDLALCGAIRFEHRRGGMAKLARFYRSLPEAAQARVREEMTASGLAALRALLADEAAA